MTNPIRKEWNNISKETKYKKQKIKIKNKKVPLNATWKSKEKKSIFNHKTRKTWRSKKKEEEN